MIDNAKATNADQAHRAVSNYCPDPVWVVYKCRAGHVAHHAILDRITKAQISSASCSTMPIFIEQVAVLYGAERRIIKRNNVTVCPLRPSFAHDMQVFAYTIHTLFKAYASVETA